MDEEEAEFNRQVESLFKPGGSAPLGNLAVDVKSVGKHTPRESAGGEQGYIYRLTFPDGMQYVGQTVNLECRMRSHANGNKCPKVQEWKARFGWDSVRIEVLEMVSHSLLNEREIHLIRECGTLWPMGLNKSRGGDGIDPLAVRESWRDPLVREKHSEARRLAWADPEKRANIMQGRGASAKVARAKQDQKQNAPEANAKRTSTWETKRAARLKGLVGKEHAQRLARLNRDRARKRRQAMEKLTQGPPASSCAKQQASVSTHGGNMDEGDGESSRQAAGARDLAHCGRKTKQTDIRVSFGVKAGA